MKQCVATTLGSSIKVLSTNQITYEQSKTNEILIYENVCANQGGEKRVLQKSIQMNSMKKKMSKKLIF